MIEQGKEIVLNADIGNNLTQLLEKLGQQIGIAADKIFPWYVQQQIIEGWTQLCLNVGICLISIFIIIYCLPKTDFDEPDKYGILSIVGGFLFFVAFLVLCANLSMYITQIINPNYHAMHTLISDLSKLR